MSDLFFITSETVPEGVGFELYGTPHLLWLLGIFLSCALCCFLCKGMAEKSLENVLRSLTAVTLSLQVLGDIILIATGRYALNYLPLDLCGIAIFGEFIDARWPGRLLSELCYCLFMPGAVMALLFSDWVSLPWWSFFCIRSFVIHALIMAYPFIKISGKLFRPDYKNLPACLGIGLGMCVPVYIIDKLLNQNFFFLNWPSPGSPLELFAAWFGIPGYLIGLPFMLVIIWVIIYLPWVILGRRQRSDRAK